MNIKDKVYVFDNIKYLLKTRCQVDIKDRELGELLLDIAFIFQLSKWIKNLKKIKQVNKPEANSLLRRKP